MTIDARIEKALRSTSAVTELRSLATGLEKEGQGHSAILQFFDENRQALHDAGRDADEDAVLEVMDFLVGWCSPHMSLAPKEP